jgi:hypothetical protein
MDDQHIFALVEAIHGTDLDAVHVFAFDAIIVDDVGHLLTLRTGFFGLCSYRMAPRGARLAPAAARERAVNSRQEFLI